MSRRTRVLFVAHGADRGGPTRQLLAFLRWVRAHEALDVEVAVLRGGELLDELREVAPVRVLEELDGAPVEDVTARRAARDLRRHWRGLDDFDLTYVNTAWTARALGYLPRPRRLLVHVHELDLGFGHLLAARDRRRVLARTDRFVVGCRAVRDLLVERHGVDPGRIALHPYFLVEQPTGFPGGGRGRRFGLGIPEHAAVVGTVAVSEWRKGPDLALEVAWHLQRLVTDREVHLVWVGGPSPGAVDATPTAADVAAAGLAGRVHVVGHQRALWDWYRAFDVFALTSREDAFPLACLEAGAVGVPTVAFATGGIGELVRDDGGRIVPFPEVDRFAAEVAELLGDEAQRARLGATVRARVAAEHDLEQRAPALVEEIERVAAR